MDTKSKSTAGKQVIGFLCFVMSFSIFFSVGLLLLEQPVYGSNSINFVLSEAFDGDVQSTQRYQSAVASRFQALMVDAGADGSFENLSFSSINEDQANVIYRISNSESGKTFSNTNVNLFQESVPEGYNYIVDYRNGNVKVTRDGRDITGQFEFWPIYDLYLERYRADSYDSYEYSDGYESFVESYGWQDLELRMAFSEKIVPTESPWSMYTVIQERFWEQAGTFIALGIAAVLLMAYIFLRKAKKAADQRIAWVSGKVWLEVKLILLFISFSIYSGFCWSSYGRRFYKIIALLQFVYYVYVLINDMRYNKGNVFRHNIIRSIMRWYRRREQYKPFQRKLVDRFWLVLGIEAALLVIGMLLFMISLSFSFRSAYYQFVFLVFVVIWIAAAVVCVCVYVKRFRKTVEEMGEVVDQVSVMKAGDMEAKLTLPADSDLYATAQDLNEIQEGFSVALEERMKSERMKIELITNVSHDIKTPLTSIIGYVELLEKEEELPEHVKDYIKILSKKSQRLKTMVQDIFDVSKASSGEMKLDIEKLDLVKLIRQTLADMDEDISGSNLIFKINLPNDPVMIRGDGERLYRVFQNVIKNSLQYSLEGSRVYISLYRDNSWTTVMIKNTSKYELGGLGENITQRFVRGDASRSTEGSGLGLSIAESFTEACGGNFRVTTDADLFTVEIAFPSVR